MLRVQNLIKQFGTNAAVNDVSFEIRPGEIYSIIGPNGSGKTTIIKTIVGLLRPSGGSVEVGGFDVVRQSIKTKSFIGYIPDEPSVWPKMTGEEFLHFVGAMYGVDEKTRTQRIPGLLSVFDLQGIEKEYFESYSRGNKQKFTILAAFLHEPKLLLIDEPIVGLDPTSAEAAKKEFARFAKNGGAVILATHTLSVAQELSHRIGVLKKGRLVASESFDGLLAKAQLKRPATLEDIYKTLTG
ncbi:MAG: hypothetical protein A2939_00930 [Parcubacteria group bacterium RIFCSPLOWO2_01_FULL_48_18]|nr:MAG: hypothetical protein A3J67_04815 [Parcubacteria group bacterium RIFCSPHIGHO2_02_FULL_48_10b]OHB22038.1 MAG: hypothetical protein A2939_00930 [Parcubacteria group bacterium RIFCSPLOWO2_01_FULL_48_18]